MNTDKIFPPEIKDIKHDEQRGIRKQHKKEESRKNIYDEEEQGHYQPGHQLNIIDAAFHFIKMYTRFILNGYYPAVVKTVGYDNFCDRV